MTNLIPSRDHPSERSLFAFRAEGSAELLAKAEQADTPPLQDGITIEGEVARRKTRKARLAQARAAIEARHYARAMAGWPVARRKSLPPAARAARSERADQLHRPRQRHHESRRRPALRAERQRASGARSGQPALRRRRVTRAPNNKEQLPPTLAAIGHGAPVVQSVAEVLIDSGFVSEATVHAVETDAQGQPTGVHVLAATGRIRHGRTVADLEKRADPPEPPPEASFTTRLAHAPPRPLVARATSCASKPSNRPSG